MNNDAVSKCLETLATDRPDHEAEIISHACHFSANAHAGQRRESGEPFFNHSLAVAEILGQLHLDHETIAAAVLHDVVEDTNVSLDDIKQDFGENIASLVDGVTKMGRIHGYETAGEVQDSKDQVRSESLRKMLLAMAEDVRVVLIKLADRLHNMRTLGSLSSSKQQRIARETMDIFAPLANRLGIWQLKWELEDLSFRYIDADAYKSIAGMLDKRRSDREKDIDSLVSYISAELKKSGVQAKVRGRPKHIYGIWKKMQKKRRAFGEIYDVRAVRITVKEVQDCYTALGIVHSNWQYIPGEFDDYIATPKKNDYRSIHTAVIGPDGKTFEIQIRTEDMNQQAEFGVAAHWRYKEGSGKDASYDEKIAWLRQLLEWKDEIVEAGEFVDQFKSEVFSDRVYLLTPKGKIIDLPSGATPLDFAYHIHTEVGHRCRGAKVDGHIVPLTYKLKTGERVDVLTIKSGQPSRDWMNPDLGYLHTSRARSKVKQWFRHLGYDETVSAGRANIEKEIRRLGLVGVSFEKIARSFSFDKVDDFFSAVGRGDLKTSRILTTIHEQVMPPAKESTLPISAPAAKPDVADAIQIQGVGNLLTHIARCCKPVPGDPVVGYITVGRGVTVHRRDCPNMLHSNTESPERMVEVSWGSGKSMAYPVDIVIEAYDRPGLLGDITTLLSNESINVLAANTLTNKSEHTAKMKLTLEIINIDSLSRLLGKIEQLPNVTDVRRQLS